MKESTKYLIFGIVLMIISYISRELGFAFITAVTFLSSLLSMASSMFMEGCEIIADAIKERK